MSVWKYLESYRLVLCHTRDDGITRKGRYCISFLKLWLDAKPYMATLSAVLYGFKWKELGFLKNRLLPCLAGCSLSSPSQDPARRGSPSAVPSSPWWRAEDNRFFSQVFQSTHSQERRTCPSPCEDGFLPGEWAVLAQDWPCHHKERLLEDEKQEQLLGGQPGRGCQASLAPQRKRSCLLARVVPVEPRLPQTHRGLPVARTPSTQVGTTPRPDLAPQRGSEKLHPCCCLDLHPQYPSTSISFPYCYPLSYSFLTSSSPCKMKDIFIQEKEYAHILPQMCMCVYSSKIYDF